MGTKQIPETLPIQYRSANVDAAPKEGERLSGADPGRFQIALTSESPARQPWGMETLKHGKENIRQSRLKSGVVPLLFNHDTRQHIGAVDSYEIADGKLRVSGPFSNSPLGQEKRRDYDDGILKAASGGYLIHKGVRKQNEDDTTAPPNVTVTDWEPLEASLLPIPADPGVGVGRGMNPGDEFPVEIETEAARSGADLLIDAPIVEVVHENPNSQPTQEKRTMAETAVPTAAELELTRRGEIMAVATDKDFRRYVSIDEAQRAIADNTAVSAFKDGVTRKIIEANDATKVGTAGDAVFGSLSEKEKKRYSVLRVVRSAVNQMKPGAFAKETADAGFEHEVSQEIKRSLKVQTEGILVPNAAYRTLGTQTIASATGQLGLTSESGVVSTITRPDVIELLRHRPRVKALGARTLGGLQGVIRIPRQDTANVAYWTTEGQAGTPADLTTDFISMQPRRITQQTSWSIELLAESSPDIEGLARMDLDKVLNLALDLAAISGTGANGQPTGIMSTTGLTLLSPSGTAFSDGGQPLVWNDVLSYESTVAAADADVFTSGWLFTPEVRKQLKGTAKFPAGMAVPIWEDGKKNPDGLEEGPLGYNAGVTNQLSKTGTKSGVTGSILHNSIFGDFAQLILADWGVSEIVVDPYTQALSGAVVITNRSLHDVAIRHIASFVANPYIAIS
jgi:HK97 family phage major capsid protein